MNFPSLEGRATRGRAVQPSGFTLIELLVVIAIIAILAAILFPVFARARENARRSSCQSQLKQLSLGVFQYTQDYDEKFPPVMVGAANWTTMTQPYLKSTQILICPSQSGTGLGTYPSYGMNVNLSVNGGVGGAEVHGISQAQVNHPSELIMLADDNLERIANQCDGYGLSGAYVNTGGYAPLWWDPRTQRGGLNTVIWFGTRLDVVGPDARHLGGANAAYADGHVKWVKYDNLYVPPTGLAAIENWKQWYAAAP